MFITNKHNVNELPGEETSMSSRLRELIPVTESLSILSGYFYFNGVPPLMDPIAANKDLKLRILVGLDVDRLGYELARAGDGVTAQERFLNSLRNVARSRLFERIAANPEDSEKATFLTECKVAWAEIAESHPEVVEKIGRLPDRVKTAASGAKPGTYLFMRRGLTLFAMFMGMEDASSALQQMKDALGAVKCPFGQPRQAKFSEGFWARYEAMMNEIAAHEVSHTEGPQSLTSRARPILMEAMANGVEREFAGKLLNDLQNRGTLPEHVLRDVVHEGRRGLSALGVYLAELNRSLGDSIAVEVPSQDDDGVIVAIDHTA